MTPSQRKPTAHDVARMAQVSSATVSYVLSGRRSGAPRVSAETRARVLAAVAALGYAPNQAARALRRSRTERVCLLLTRLGVPSFDLLAQAVQRSADQHGYSVIITIGDSPVRAQQALEQLRRGLADGAIIACDLAQRDADALVASGVAVVAMGNPITGVGIDSVRTTEIGACYEATQYLIARGHRRIAFLGLPPNDPRPSRYQGYARALSDADIAVDPLLVQSSAGSREEAYASTRRLLQHGRPPTALLAAADIAAMSAIMAARDLGLRVPDDLAVIGVGNLPEGEMMHPRLTTVGQQPLEFETTAELLFSRLRGEAPAEGRTLIHPWRLIIREST
jgi:DNA-binding LacI/PurR family transcriptional regulator